MAMTEYDKAVFEDHLFRALDRYIPAVKEWYAGYYDRVYEVTGSTPVPDAPNGLMQRFNMTEKHSAIKGLQAFPFVATAALQLPRASGGIRQMVRAILGEDFYKYGSMYLLIKQSLVNTNNAGQFIIFVTEEFFNALPRGRFIWMNESELEAFYRRVCPRSVSERAKDWLSAAQRKAITKGIMESEYAVKYEAENEDEIDKDFI